MPKGKNRQPTLEDREVDERTRLAAAGLQSVRLRRRHDGAGAGVLPCLAGISALISMLGSYRKHLCQHGLRGTRRQPVDLAEGTDKNDCQGTKTRRRNVEAIRKVARRPL